MFYLSKFCRICIQTGGSLLDINSRDYDSVKLSEKLEQCTKMVITNESLSTQICMLCVQKLRISYQFQAMCKQSSKVLQGYLSELLSVSDKITPEQFKNSELRVTVTPLANVRRHRRKRISKEQRCSLLKKLLTSQEKNKEIETEITIKEEPLEVSEKEVKGGLRGLINFTRNFDYGYDIDPNKNYELSPLEKLTDFSERFFCNDFTDFRNTILYILNSKDDDSDDDDKMFDACEEIDSTCKFEEVIVEPDIKIKTEIVFEDENLETEYEYSSNFVEACYSNQHSKGGLRVKKEFRERQYVTTNMPEVEIIPITSTSSYKNTSHIPSNSKSSSKNNFANKYKTLFNALNSPSQMTPPPPTELLDQFVAKFSNNRRTISPNSLRCRTRGNPYINPLLQKQFQTRNFKCQTCNRRFKSPGYLKAHMSKVKHI